MANDRLKSQNLAKKPMIDEHKSVGETLKESSIRLDGKVMLLMCMSSIFLGTLWLVLTIFSTKTLEELWKALFGIIAIPILIFTIYVRLRQVDSSSSFIYQIKNSVFVLISGSAFLYVIFFKE